MKLTFEELAILLNIISSIVLEENITLPECLTDEYKKIIKSQLIYEGINRNRSHLIAENITVEHLIDMKEYSK